MPSRTAPVATTDDADLVRSACAGDRLAFGRLHDLYARMVHGILLARGPRREADDLVQDVFVMALRKLHTLRDAGTFGSWLAVIARNRASDFRRRMRKVEELKDDMARAGPTHASRAEAEEMLAVVRELPEAYRETLILRLVEGMTGPEIAERTGLTPGSVRVNLCRGMKQLREKLGLPGLE
ncbi:MAG: sigma-70 family RNA polymerase sigma factor [Planctomycetes bacterium]|nr:sigma-70 family RNA polymerase sigma factor [Planctomycetota bacterium]